jgi:hypothetical protein
MNSPGRSVCWVMVGGCGMGVACVNWRVYCVNTAVRCTIPCLCTHRRRRPSATAQCATSKTEKYRLCSPQVFTSHSLFCPLALLCAVIHIPLTHCCSDVAGRGIDMKNLRVIINYDFPPTLQQYVHRCGRTGRGPQPAATATATDSKADAKADAKPKPPPPAPGIPFVPGMPPPPHPPFCMCCLLKWCVSRAGAQSGGRAKVWRTRSSLATARCWQPI